MRLLSYWGIDTESQQVYIHPKLESKCPINGECYYLSRTSNAHMMGSLCYLDVNCILNGYYDLTDARDYSYSLRGGVVTVSILIVGCAKW